MTTTYPVWRYKRDGSGVIARDASHDEALRDQGFITADELDRPEPPPPARKAKGARNAE